jgi:hypothetical protein
MRGADAGNLKPGLGFFMWAKGGAMTTVISRIYADEAAADRVLTVLKKIGFPEAQIDKIKGGHNTLEAMQKARLNAGDAALYAEMMRSDETLVVVRAYITPFGAAKRAMEVMDQGAPLTVTGVPGDRYIREEPDPALYRDLSIFTNHPFMALKEPLGADSHRCITAMSHEKLLIKTKRRLSIMEGVYFLSSGARTTSRKPKDNIVKGGKRYLYNPPHLR